MSFTEPSQRTATKAPNIRAWRMQKLINDLALGDKPYSVLAEEHGVEDQTVRLFAMNHRPEVEARKADFASEYSHIWSTRLGNRLGIMTQRLEEIEDQLELLRDHARRQTEMIRTVDPDASEVPVHGSEYRAYEKEQRALLREIADQCGQLPTRVAVQTQAAPLTFGATLVEDEHGQFHPVRQ